LKEKKVEKTKEGDALITSGQQKDLKKKKNALKAKMISKSISSEKRIGKNKNQ